MKTYISQYFQGHNTRGNLQSVAAILLVYLIVYVIGSQVSGAIGAAFSLIYLVLVPGYPLAKLFKVQSSVHRFLAGFLFSIFFVTIFGYATGQTGIFSGHLYAATSFSIAIITEIIFVRRLDNSATTRLRHFIQDIILSRVTIIYAGIIFLLFSIFVLLFHTTIVTQDEFIQYGRAIGLVSTGSIPKFEPFLVPLAAISAPAGTFIFDGTLLAMNPAWNEHGFHIVPAFLITILIVFAIESLPRFFRKIPIISESNLRFLFPIFLLAPFFLARSTLLLGETFGMVMLVAAIFVLAERKYLLAALIIVITTLYHDFWGIHVLLITLLLTGSNLVNHTLKNWKYGILMIVIFSLAWAISHYYYTSTIVLSRPVEIDSEGNILIPLADAFELWRSAFGLPYIVLGLAGAITVLYKKERRIFLIWFVASWIPFLLPGISPDELVPRRFIPQMTIASAYLGFYFFSHVFEKLAMHNVSKSVSHTIMLVAIASVGWSILDLAGVIETFHNQFNERYFILIVALITLSSVIFVLRHWTRARLILTYGLLTVPLIISVISLSMLGGNEVDWYEQIVTAEQLGELRDLKESLGENGVSSNFMLAAYVGTMLEKPVKTISPFQTSADTVYSDIFNYTVYNELYHRSGGVDPTAKPLSTYPSDKDLYYITLQGGNIASDTGNVVSSLDNDSRFQFIRSLSGSMYIYKVDTENLSFEEHAIRAYVTDDSAIIYSTKTNVTDIPFLASSPTIKLSGYSTNDIIEEIANNYPEHPEGSENRIIILPGNGDPDFLLDPRFQHVFSRNSPVLEFTDHHDTSYIGADKTWRAFIYQNDSNLEGIETFLPTSYNENERVLFENPTDTWITEPLGSGDRLKYTYDQNDERGDIINVLAEEAHGNWIVAQRWLDRNENSVNIFGYDEMNIAIKVEGKTEIAIGFVDYKGVYWQAHAQEINPGWNDLSFKFDRAEMPNNFNLAYVSKLDISIPNDIKNDKFVIGMMEIQTSEPTSMLAGFKIPKLDEDQIARISYQLPMGLVTDSISVWIKASTTTTGFLAVTYSDGSSDKIQVSMGPSWKEAAILLTKDRIPSQLILLPDSSNIRIIVDGPYVD